MGFILAALVEDDVLETVGRRGSTLAKGLEESIGEVAPDPRIDMDVPTMGIGPIGPVSVTVSARLPPISEEPIESVLRDS